MARLLPSHARAGGGVDLASDECHMLYEAFVLDVWASADAARPPMTCSARPACAQWTTICPTCTLMKGYSMDGISQPVRQQSAQYSKPVLSVLGTVGTLTQAGTGVTQESGACMAVGYCSTADQTRKS